MYINKKSLLIKKIGNKSISVFIKEKKITKENIKKLSLKEFEYIKKTNSYINFEKELFDKKILEYVVFNSIFLSNLYELKIDENLNKKIINFPRKFIYESNKAEGSKIPFEQLQIIFEGKKSNYKNKNEIKEIENSIKLWEFLQKRFAFNEMNIKKIYHILTKDLLQENGENYPRGFKKCENIVNNSVTTKPEFVKTEINNLISFYKNNKKNIFPLQLSFDFHLFFENIHPFANGNGRIGRFLMNKILISSKYLPFMIFSDNRQAYFNAIKSYENRNKKKYYKFMLEQYKKTLEYYLI